MEKFIRLLEKGAAASSTTQIDLEALKKEFNLETFNSLVFLNTSTTTPLIILLDGVEVAYVTANNGIFDMKPEYLLKYSFLAVKNETANVLTDELKIIVGQIGAY